MEKISLNTSPSSILSATIGAEFELDGVDLLLCGKDLIYLCDEAWNHIRNKEGYALMTREEMCSILESGNYFIE